MTDSQGSVGPDSQPPADDISVASIDSAAPSSASTSFLSTNSALLTTAALDHPLNLSSRKRARSLHAGFDNVDESNLPSDPLQLKTIQHDGRKFTKSSYLESKGKRAKRTGIDAHGIRLREILEDGGQATLEWWSCKACDDKGAPKLFRLPNGGTSSAINHLLEAHGIAVTKRGVLALDDAKISPRTTIDKLFARQQSKKKYVVTTHAEEVRDTLINWVVKKDLATAIVEDSDFRKFCHLMNAAVADEAIPNSHNTLASWIHAKFSTHLEIVKEEICQSPYKKHLTFDAWTAPNSHPLLGINCHFINRQHRLQTVLIGLSIITGAHVGENLGSILKDACSRFGI